MSSHNPIQAPLNAAAEAPPTVAPDIDKGSEWQKRRTVLCDIHLGNLDTGGIAKRKWDPNSWRLSYQGTLTLLRAEAFRAQSQTQHYDPAERTAIKASGKDLEK